MKKIRLLKIDDNILVQEFIKKNKSDFLYFEKLGWNKTNVENQLKKNNSLSLGYFNNEELVGLLLGETLNFERNLILEIHVLIVIKDFRRKKIATKILKYIEKENDFCNISTLLIEVAEDNSIATRFYRKNSFVYYNFRPNYYRYDNKLINASCFKKIIKNE